jgi:mono/diheme cytochrome c family protein
LLPGLVLVISGCSLAGDVTPPPALATAQAAQPLPTAGPSPTPLPTPTAALPLQPLDPRAGAATFAGRCASCHGAAGLGDGPQASGLPNAPAALGDPQLARQAVPADWFKVVTQGRMDQFMPPFGPSLSDTERWNVVAYALTLSTTADDLAKGKDLYQTNCADCHAADGRGTDKGPDLTVPQRMIGQSLASLFAAIGRGSGSSMPAFADKLAEPDRWTLAAYVRSLAFASSALVSGGTPAPTAVSALGVVEGKIVNGTPGGSVPPGLPVTLHGFDADTEVVTEKTTSDASGAFRFDGLQVVSGRIFGVTAEYNGVSYYSQGAHVTDPATPLDLPVTIYDTTTQADTIGVDRIHLLFDFSAQGVVQVVELWVLSNHGDRTIVSPAGAGTFKVALPPGAANLGFQEGALGGRYLSTQDGFADTQPIPPGSASAQLIFSFTLPYARSLDFSQSTGYAVDAVVVLVPEGGPAVRAAGLQDLGTNQASGESLHSYALGALTSGQKVSLQISGSSVGSAPPVTSEVGIAIGAGVLGAVLVLVGLWWYRSARPRTPSLAPAEPEGQEPLLRAIAALDEAFERGEVPEVDYRRQREDLKRRALRLMERGDD